MPAPPDVRKWFEDVVSKNYRLFFATAYRTLRNSSDAEDAVQTAILKGFQGIKSLENPDTVVGWLARITRHCALDMLKKGGKVKTHAVGDNTGVFDRPIEEEQTPMSDSRQVLHDEIGNLPDTQAQVVTLRHLEGLEVDDIARRLGITVNSARVRLFRAYESLRKNARVRSALGMDS